MIRNRKKIFAIIYLIAIILYISQGILFEGTWFTSLSGVYVLFYGLINFFIVLRSKSHPFIFTCISYFMYWTLFIWLLFPKYYNFQGESISTTTMLQYIIMVCCASFSFYRISKFQLLGDIPLKCFTIVLGCLFVYNILHFDVTTLDAGEYNYSSANNKSYLLAALFPFYLLFWKNKIVMFSMMIASMIFVIFLLKRGTMLCVASFLILTLYFSYKEAGASKKKLRVWVMRILVISFLCAAVYAISNIYQDNEIIQARLGQDSSGRDIIYSKILKTWLNSNLLNLIIGYGPFSTIPLIGIYAHNDWLEILLDFGLVGMIIYLMITLVLLKKHCLDRQNYQYKTSFIICLLYIIIRSSFSMCIYELETILVFGFLGYTIGNKERIDIKKYENTVNS